MLLLELLQVRQQEVVVPKWLHEALKRSARKKGLKGKRKKAYIHGTLQKHKKRKKGRKKLARP